MAGCPAVRLPRLICLLPRFRTHAQPPLEQVPQCGHASPGGPFTAGPRSVPSGNRACPTGIPPPIGLIRSSTPPPPTATGVSSRAAEVMTTPFPARRRRPGRRHSVPSSLAPNEATCGSWGRAPRAGPVGGPARAAPATAGALSAPGPPRRRSRRPRPAWPYVPGHAAGSRRRRGRRPHRSRANSPAGTAAIRTPNGGDGTALTGPRARAGRGDSLSVTPCWPPDVRNAGYPGIPSRPSRGMIHDTAGDIPIVRAR